MEIVMEVGRSGFASVEVSGSFHGNTWNFPLSSIEASTNMFRGSFHELTYTPRYFHLLSRV